MTKTTSVSFWPDTKRVLLFWLGYFIIIAACLFCFAQFLPKKWWWYGWGISASAGALMLTRYFIKKENKSILFDWLKPDKRSPWKFLSGLILGAGIIGMIVLLLSKLLHLNIIYGKLSVFDFFVGSVALIPCAFHEELGFRYYTFKKLGSVISPWKTQLLIALLFALYHISGGQDIANSLFSTTLWSIVFAMAAKAGNGLALSTGIHAGSTIGQALFGLKIQEGFPSLYSLVPTGATASNTRWIALTVQSVVLIAVILSMLLLPTIFKQKKVSY